MAIHRARNTPSGRDDAGHPDPRAHTCYFMSFWGPCGQRLKGGGPGKLCLNIIYTTACLSSIFNLSKSFMFMSPSAAKLYLLGIQQILSPPPPPHFTSIPLLQHLDRFFWKLSFAIFFLEHFPLAFISPGYLCQSFCPSAQARDADTLCSRLSPLPPHLVSRRCSHHAQECSPIWVSTWPLALTYRTVGTTTNSSREA